MDKKILTGIAAILVFISTFVAVRFLSPEDAWICVKGEWIRRGNPSADKPIETCPGQKIEANSVVNSPEANQVVEKKYEVYFPNNKLDQEISCVRVFPIVKSAGDDELSLKKTLEVLFQGPSEKDKEAGYFTSIPENVKINSIEKDGVSIKVDFSRDIENGMGGSCRVTAMRAQIVRTVLAFDKSIRSVIISVEGNVNALQP